MIAKNTNAAARALPVGLLILLAAATSVLHLVVGLYYATSQAYGGKLTLQARDAQYLASFPGWDTDNELDGASYNRAAMEVLRTGLPRSREGVLFVRAPVYAYFLAGCYWAGGVRLISLAIPQAALSGLTCLLAAWAASRITQQQNKWAIPLVGLLALVNLRVAMYVGYAVPVIPVLFLLAVMLFAAARAPGPGQAACVTIGAALGTYTQAAFFVVAFAAACWLAWMWLRQHRRSHLAGAAIVLLFIFGKFPLTWLDVAGKAHDPARAADRGGTLWLANNPYYESMRPWSLWEARPGNPWTRWTASEQERTRYESYLERAQRNELRAALLWMRENPAQYAKLCFIRLRTELGPFTGQMSPRHRLVSTVLWLVIFPAGFYGLWQTRSLPVTQLSVWIVLGVVAFHTLVISEWYLRYRLPAELVLTIYAGIAYSRLSGLRRP